MHGTSAICPVILVLTAFGASALAAEGPAGSLRMQVCLNGLWQRAPGGEEMRMPEAGWQDARTPALPIAEEGHPAAMWYRLNLDAPERWARPGRRFFLEFEKVGHYAAVFCNGQKVGEHYGQYAPFEVELTPAFRPGSRNTIAVYVHDASGRYVRPGAVVEDTMVGPAYRPGARGAGGRNWIGIVGDITLSWRPNAYVKDVFVVTSVREKSIEARLELSPEAAGAGLTCRAAVLDGDRVVLELPERPTAASVTLSAPWADPVLWGPPPYGEPKLYVLRTELLSGNRVVDRAFTRFGFREVWVDGRELLLNGRRLWMVGTYGVWLDARRYINDRRPMAAELRAMQAAGLNTLNGHWDGLGRTYMDLCDEMGMFIWSSMYCNSQLPFQPKADEGWADWMAQQTAEWVRARRNHPSIMAWRPFCGRPKNLATVADPRAFSDAVRAAVKANDGTRPIGDRTDIWDRNQGSTNPKTGEYDDASGLARVLRQVPQPVMTVEIWTGFSDVEGMSGFFRKFYDTSYRGGAAGFIPQHLPFFAPVDFTVRWLSLSGPGNRDADWRVRQRCVNWCDPRKPPYEKEPYGQLFARLYEEYTGRPLAVYGGELSPEVLVTGAPGGAVVEMAPGDSALQPAQGLLAAPDGTAWFVLPRSGDYTLRTDGVSRAVRVPAQSGIPKPGYDYVQRVSLSAE